MERAPITKTALGMEGNKQQNGPNVEGHWVEREEAIGLRGTRALGLLMKDTT